MTVRLEGTIRRYIGLSTDEKPVLGLQGFQGVEIVTPRAAALKPRAEFLAERYELFRKAS